MTLVKIVEFVKHARITNDSFTIIYIHDVTEISILTCIFA